MKTIILASTGFLLMAVPVFAQTTPNSDSTALGDATTSGNAAGMPSAGTPAGEMKTTGSVNAAPAAVPSHGGTPVAQATNPTADSTVTDTTTR